MYSFNLQYKWRVRIAFPNLLPNENTKLSEAPISNQLRMYCYWKCKYILTVSYISVSQFWPSCSGLLICLATTDMLHFTHGVWWSIVCNHKSGRASYSLFQTRQTALWRILHTTYIYIYIRIYVWPLCAHIACVLYLCAYGNSSTYIYWKWCTNIWCSARRSATVDGLGITCTILLWSVVAPPTTNSLINHRFAKYMLVEIMCWRCAYTWSPAHWLTDTTNTSGYNKTHHKAPPP